MVRAREGISIDDALQLSIGEFGKEQRRLYLLLNLVTVLAMLQIYAMVFTELNPLAQQKWKCMHATDRTCMKLLREQETMDIGEFKEEFCSMKPERWMWTEPRLSMVSDFELQCSTWKVSIVDGMFFAGVLIGASFFGYLSDRIGRRSVMYISMMLAGLSCIFTSVAPSYWWYLIFRTTTGVGSGGAGLTAFVLTSEFLGPSKRGRLLIALQIFATVGSCLVAGLGFVLPYWRKILFVIGTLSLLYMITWDATMESPRWLLVKGRKGEATAVLAALASGNNTRLPEAPLHDMVTIPSVSRTFLQILKHPSLRGWFLITLLSWCSVSLSYYGLSMAMEFLPGSIYTTFLSTIVIEFPAIVFYMLMVDRVGRKPLFAWGFILGGVSCVLIAIAPKWLSLILAVLCRFAVAGVYAVAYLYSSEIFPTVVRNVTIGYASAAARVGGILGSFVPVTARFFGSFFPFLILGSIGICAGLACFLLPETLGMATPETVEDMDQMLNARKRGYERLDIYLPVI